MPTIAELIKKATGSSPDEMSQAVKTLNELYGQTPMGQQDFGPEDSTIASTVAHPIKGAGKLAEWFRGNVNTAAGYSDPFDNPNPLLGPSMDKKAEAGLDLAGMLQTGAMPFAPKSAGGTLGTMIKQGTPETEFTRAHALAQKNAALPVEQGGLGLHPDNTAMDRAKALGFDTKTPLYHGTKSDITEFTPSIGGEYGSGVYTSPDATTADMFSSFARGEGGDNIIELLSRSKNPLITSDRNKPRGLGVKGLLKKGFDSVEGISATGERQNVSLNPNQLRSRFAAFDPMKKDSANILASVLGGTALASQYDKKKKLKDMK